jgi:hypothetical protein
VFDGAIGGLARLGRQAMVGLTWILILVALALATWATIHSSRAQEPTLAGATATGAVPGLPAPARGQPVLANQNVSGR